MPVLVYTHYLCARILLPALFVVMVCCLATARAGFAETVSFALVGEPKYPRDFEHFDYVEPDAPKGGTLRQGTRVSFDTTNGMRFPGKMANELDYIYDTLMVRAEDEPASFYGLLARDVHATADFSRVTYDLQEDATWHDGTRLTARDVVFTFRTVAKHGLPTYREILDGVEIKALSDTVVTFEAESADWRLLEFTATFPVFQADFWENRDVSKTTLDVPIGSGPYRVAKLDHNIQTVLERVPDYWGVDLPVNRGRWNFDQIVTDYYKDVSILVEAMRAGRIDGNREWSPLSWLQKYEGPALEEGRIVKRAFDNPRGASYEALVFNLRRPPLDDLRVRTALTLVFDSAFVRESFSGGLMTAPKAHFAGTIFAPEQFLTDGEAELLAPFREILPPGLFNAPQPPDFGDLSARERIGLADRLLQDAGYVMNRGVRVNAQTGEALVLNHVGANASSRSVLNYYASVLDTIGVKLEVSYSDYVTASRMILNHEWDITSMGGRTRFPPGAEERAFWHSERALIPGYALAGAQDPALDAAIDQMTQSTGFEEMQAAARAFSRVLAWQRYLLPFWQNDQIWIAHRAQIGFPSRFSPGNFHYISSLFWIP